MMGNGGKTSVLALFPANKPYHLKNTQLICMPSCKQKNAILVLIPTLNITQTVTLALINHNVNPNLNLKSKLELDRNDFLRLISTF